MCVHVGLTMKSGNLDKALKTRPERPFRGVGMTVCSVEPHWAGRLGSVLGNLN